MTVIGLDLNATRARAVIGPEGAAPRPLALDEPRRELPLALSLEGRHPQVGQAGMALCRELPHLVCLDFLAHLGTPQTWSAGRHRLDASRAMALVLDHLRPACADTKGATLAVPNYLSRSQVALLEALARKARLPLLGSVTAPLAAALAAYAEQSWSGLAVLIDADDHALTWTALKAGKGELQLLGEKRFPKLNLRAWKTGLLNAIADCCIRHSRRDPRDSGAAEQHLYDQLEDVLDAAKQEEMLEVVIRTEQWCQNLILQPQQVQASCAPLVRQVTAGIDLIFETAPEASINLILLTAAVERLPGLVAALLDSLPEHVAVVPLAPDAAALGAHDLAARCQRGEVPRDHLDATVPLPKGSEPGVLGNLTQRIIPLAADR